MEVGSGKMGAGGGTNGCFVCHVSPLYACSSRNLAPLQCGAQANNPFWAAAGRGTCSWAGGSQKAHWFTRTPSECSRPG